jgi:hypothetical protein
MGLLPSGFLPKSKHLQYKSVFNFSSDEPILYQALDIRKKKNMDSIVVVVGAKRTSKSYFCMKACEDLATKWNCNFKIDNVFYEIEDMLKFMNNNNDSLGVMEEAGFFLSSTSWQTIQNKIVRNMTQTQGFRKNVIFLNLPHFAFLDRSLRLMTSFVVETMEIGKVKVYKVNVQHALGEGYMTFLETIDFGLPSAELVEEYEAKKKIYNDRWLSEDIEYLQLLSGEKQLENRKKFGYGFYIDAFNFGSIDAEQLKEHLSQLGYNPKDVELMINNENIKLAMELNV